MSWIEARVTEFDMKFSLVSLASRCRLSFLLKRISMEKSDLC